MDGNDAMMYVSPAHIHQLLGEMGGDPSQLEGGLTGEISSSVEEKLRALARSGSTGSERGNQNEAHCTTVGVSLIKATQIANELVHSEEIPPVSSLFESPRSVGNLYHFSCLVLLNPVEAALDDETYLNVTGIQGDVRFEGNTSVENWTSRSHLRTAIDADEPYPFQGLLTPLAEVRNLPDGVEFAVQFLLIVAPNRHQFQRWENRQALINEQYEMRYGSG